MISRFSGGGDKRLSVWKNLLIQREGEMVMNRFGTLLLGVALVFSASVALAEDKPTEGKVVCAKCTAKIEGAGCSPAFIFKGKDGKEQTLLLAGKVVKGKGCEGIAHGKFCKPGSGVTVTITGKVADGKFTATKIVAKKK